MEACWNQQWNERPAVSTVLSCLTEASRYWNPPSPTTASAEIESHDRDGDSDDSSLISGVPGFCYKPWLLLNVLPHYQTIPGQQCHPRASVSPCTLQDHLSELLSDPQRFTSTSEVIDQAYLDVAIRSKDGFIALLKLRDEKAIVVINLIHTARHLRLYLIDQSWYDL
jgi:hypothetical protein